LKAGEAERATAGEDVAVDYSTIEKSLAQLWRSENEQAEGAVIRAALWNVVAHTSSPALQTHAAETLSKAAVLVPQRTIVIRSEPDSQSEMTAWISANCHMLGGKKQVCSEEVTIVAGGDHIHQVAPLVSALLLPDMPVAMWWVGDLPNEHEAYIETLLESADRLIVDSSYFDRAADFALVARIARQTATAPADLNWVRLEEWRMATAALFDPANVRARLRGIRKVSITAVAGENAFGDATEAFLYAAWLSAQLGHNVSDEGKVEGAAGPIGHELRVEKRDQRSGSLAEIAILFDDGSTATLLRDEDRQVINTSIDGATQTFDLVTRMQSRRIDDLIVRQLKRVHADPVFMKVLPIVSRIAGGFAA
jgi:glucose-6-phosphate dehydrogenase assembly protein OpcA